MGTHGSSAVRMAVVAFISVGGLPRASAAQEVRVPAYLRDRGGGVSTSMFGTYVRRGELLVYPFLEYARDHNLEYQPQEFGLGPDVNFRGKFRGSAGQLFLAYGLTDRIAIELEGAVVDQTLDKSPLDSFGTPARIHESGIADIEAQVRARLLTEHDRRPEIFGFLEVTFPSHTRSLLIGDPDLDLRPGVGITRGFSWGTMTVRAAGEYNRAGKNLDFGEVAVEYLKRLASPVHLYLAVEGGEGGALDEWDFISGVRWRLGRYASLKFDNAIGISSKSTDWAPQIGLMLSLHGRAVAEPADSSSRSR